MAAMNNVTGSKKTSITALIVMGLGLAGIFLPQYQEKFHAAALTIASAGLAVSKDPSDGDPKPSDPPAS